MEKEELIAQIQKELSPEFIVKDIDNVNHKPHLFMIGSKHIEHASKLCGGMLGDETLKVIPCAMPNCTLLYSEHTFDKVCFIQLTRNLTNREAQKKLKLVVKLLEQNKVDGFCFVDTPEKYRVE